MSLSPDRVGGYDDVNEHSKYIGLTISLPPAPRASIVLVGVGSMGKSREIILGSEVSRA